MSTQYVVVKGVYTVLDSYEHLRNFCAIVSREQWEKFLEFCKRRDEILEECGSGVTSLTVDSIVKEWEEPQAYKAVIAWEKLSGPTEDFYEKMTATGYCNGHEIDEMDETKNSVHQ